MRDISDKVVENIKTRTLCSEKNFFPENGTFYEVIWKNVVELDKTQMAK